MSAYVYRGTNRRPSCSCGHHRPKRRRESVVRVVALNESAVVQAVASNV